VDFNVYPHVLRVCKQIHAEAASVFYGRNEMRLLFYGGDDVPHQRCRSGFLSLSRVGSLYLRLVRRLELIIFAEREQILGEINITNPVHRLLAEGNGMQGLECLTIVCYGTNLSKAQISARSKLRPLSFRDMVVDCLSQIARTTHLTALIQIPWEMWNNSSDSTMRLIVPEKVKLAPGEVLLDLGQITSKNQGCLAV
jgi:hypothetical protein